MSPLSAAAAYEIKSADLPLVAFQLRTLDLQQVASGLQAQLADTPDFFDQDPVLIDLDSLPPGSEGPLDFVALQALLQQHGLRPVAVRTSRADWLQAAQALGLSRADEVRVRRPMAQLQEAVVAPPPRAASTLADAMVVDKPLRSGQQVYAKGRDLIVLAMVNAGAEVLADGHIHVYAPLRGKAIAGAKGFTGARIFAQSMDPELISIAGVYRTSENPLPVEVRGRAAQVSLQSTAEGERLMLAPL